VSHGSYHNTITKANYAPTEWLRQNSENHGVRSTLCALFVSMAKFELGVCTSQLSGEQVISSRSRRKTRNTLLWIQLIIQTLSLKSRTCAPKEEDIRYHVPP